MVIKGTSYISSHYRLAVNDRICMHRVGGSGDLGLRVSLTLSTCTGASSVLE